MKHSLLSLSVRMMLLQMVLLVIVSCLKDAKIYQQEHINFPIKGVLCEASEDSILCQTSTGAKLNPFGILDICIVPNDVWDYDEDDFEILSNVDQYIHLDSDCRDSVVIQMADVYNALTMLHSVINDMEVTERYEESTSKEISQMDCSILHNPDWRQLLEQVRNAYAKSNKNPTQKNIDAAQKTVEDVYLALGNIVSPIMEQEYNNYITLNDRSSYLTNFSEFETLRGSGDKEYQKKLLSTYDKTPNIDLKCIWALEFAHSSMDNAYFLGGAVLLEEVMLNQTYSPYLDEIWATWRAIITTLFPISNYGYIPNIFYNKMRMVCATTILDYIKTNPLDSFAQAMFINLADRNNIVRHGGPFGNSSSIEQMTFFPEWNK